MECVDITADNSHLEVATNDLEPAEKTEIYAIPADQDHDGLDRNWCCVKECPLKDECKPRSFAKSSCYSFISHEVCMQYVMRHLQVSGHHLKTQEEAVNIMKATEMKWEYGVDTYKDRQHYREQLDVWTKAHERKKSGGGGLGSTGSGGSDQVDCRGNKRPREDQSDDLQAIDKVLNRALQTQLYQMMDADITGDIHKKQALQMNGVLELGKAPSDVTVSAEQIKHLRDVLVRSDSSLSNAKTRCLELARSLHNEQVSVRDALVTLKRLIESAT